jgi:hypothetical protein
MDFLPHLNAVEVVKDMGIIEDAKLILAQAEKQEPKKQHIVGFDIYYVLLLENGFLPSSVATFPNRVLTRALHADMLERVPDLRFTACRSVGVYFGQKRFRDLGIAPWRHMTGNGWAFPRLSVLRQDWERRQNGWQWPNQLQDWVREPMKPAEYNRSTTPP